MAELELSHLSRQCLNRRIPDQETMIQETAARYISRNNEAVKVDWQFTTEDARITTPASDVITLCRISDFFSHKKSLYKRWIFLPFAQARSYRGHQILLV